MKKLEKFLSLIQLGSIVIAGSVIIASCGRTTPRLITHESAGPQARNSDESTTPPVTTPDATTDRGSEKSGQAFLDTFNRMVAEKPVVESRQMDLLSDRYDLSDRPRSDVTMFNGKAIQAGPRARLAAGTTWASLDSMSPDEIRNQDVFPKGFRPLPHPHHEEGGMVFPRTFIAEIDRQERRSLERFDLDFDLPEIFLPEFPAPIFLTTHPELGDVSQRQVVTNQNFYELFNEILTVKQLDGLRLLLTPFPQQQFNFTDDRRSEHPSTGVACFDCHTNGHTNGATHIVGDTKPQATRHRVDTPSLRGVNIQRLFGSQRALKTVEDFTEFEQSGAYFDGDLTLARLKGTNFLDRLNQVQGMAEFQELLNFPPAPKLGLDGKLIVALATPEELRGQELFFGRAQCSSCHAAPYYTDNSMHDLELQRFFAPTMANGQMMLGDGPVKTTVLRGIRHTPPYLHDGRLLTLEDTVEFFNLVLGIHLTDVEKSDLTSFMMAL